LFYAALWITAAFYSLVRGHLVGDLVGDAFVPELPAVLTVYLVICSKPSTAAVFAVSQGLLVDLYSGGLRGLFSGFYLAIFCFALLSRSLFDIHHAKGQLIITSLAVALGKVLVLITVNFVSPDASFLWPRFCQAVSAAFLTGILSPLLISVLQMARRHYISGWTDGFEAELDEVGVLPRLWRPREPAGGGPEPEDSTKSEKL
jgi:rod shape-determining protein MreD